ncbi:MAG: DUF4214 domain-containing protein [Clostridia bacterium]|nr:DUF4214 domain-containing protein [Clostridia bacterium]
MKERIKRFLAALVVVPIAFGFCSNFLTNDVHADTIVVKDMAEAFPDYYFRNYVYRNFDLDGDYKLSANEIAAVKNISVSNKAALISDGAGPGTAVLDSSKVTNIRSLKGIEYFTNLETLDVSYNLELETMDLSSNTKLKKIIAHNTGIWHLDISKLTELTELRAWNTELKGLYIGNNKSLSSLDVSFTNIDFVNVYNNPIFINAVKNGSTTTSWLSKEYKMYRDGSVVLCVNSDTYVINLTDNQMDIDASTFGSDWFCSYLRDMADKNFDGTLSIEERDNFTEIVADGYTMSKIDGLENFKNLEKIDVSDAGVNEIDLTGCFNLKYLYCNRNNISSLNLSDCTKLEDLICYHNAMTSIDLKPCTKLRCIWLSYNQLGSIDLSNNKDLVSADFTDCGLTNINLSGLSELCNLYLNDNNLTSIDVSSCSSLRELFVDGNNIQTLNISNCPNLVNTYENATPSIEINYTDNGKYEYYCYASYISGVGRLFLGVSMDTKVISNQPITPTPTPTSTPVPTAKPTTTPAPNLPVNDTAVAGFAERLYTKCLNRASDPSGKSYWISKLKEGKSGAAVAKEFFFSQEFTGFGLDDKEYVTRLYRTFMDREPDASGLNYWLNELANGRTREFVFYGFVNSQEWANICLTYGIVSGGNKTASITKQPTAAINDFTTRMYTTCLGRNAEPSGQAYWAGELANMRKTGTQVAYEFFFSSEFTNANHSDSEFVTRLYRTFMGREPDTDGFNYWLNQLANGASRKAVFDGFSTSQEFSNLCIEAGILR